MDKKTVHLSTFLLFSVHFFWELPIKGVKRLLSKNIPKFANHLSRMILHLVVDISAEK